jgi:intein-encoded DNA endonuclease-like protein
MTIPQYNATSQNTNILLKYKIKNESSIKYNQDQIIKWSIKIESTPYQWNIIKIVAHFPDKSMLTKIQLKKSVYHISIAIMQSNTIQRRK